jgi:hypothetical protein
MGNLRETNRQDTALASEIQGPIMVAGTAPV